MNIIYDINNQELKKKIRDKMNQDIVDFHEITYQQMVEPIVIFKCINHEKDLARLKKYHIPPHSLILIIQSGELMFQLLEYYPLSYIRMDYFDIDLEKSIQLIKDIHNQEDNIMTFKMKHSYVQMKCSQIYYIESYQHYLMIYTHSGEYKVREKLSKAIETLKGFGFVQVHRSYIVNKRFIEKVYSDKIVLNNLVHIPMSKKYKLDI